MRIVVRHGERQRSGCHIYEGLMAQPPELKEQMTAKKSQPLTSDQAPSSHVSSACRPPFAAKCDAHLARQEGEERLAEAWEHGSHLQVERGALGRPITTERFSNLFCRIPNRQSVMLNTRCPALVFCPALKASFPAQVLLFSNWEKYPHAISSRLLINTY